MHIVIIGNGIAGSTAARYIRKQSDHKITMISGETEFPFSRTALMYIFMGHMRFDNTKLYEDWFWEKNRINILKAWVKSIHPENKNILLEDGSTIAYDKLIIATGSKSNKFGWPGQDLEGVQGLYHLDDLESMNHAVVNGLKKAVIVGGGLIGIEMAEMLHSKNVEVTVLVREDSFWNMVLPPEESEMINQHIVQNGIDLRLGEEVTEILGDDGKVVALMTKSGERIDCQFVGLTVGVSPNIEFLNDSGIETNRGILVNENLSTSDEHIFAIGDCTELRAPSEGRRNIEAVWYTGKMMGQTVASTICGQDLNYNPGVWYNSAKFFEIEYQVYGTISTQNEADIISLYWQHPTENKAVRINYSAKDKSVLGFNLLGIRYRHKVCEKWIKESTHIDRVLENLSLANFDPEFFELYEADIIAKYNQIGGASIRLKSKSKLRHVLEFIASSGN